MSTHVQAETNSISREDGLEPVRESNKKLSESEFMKIIGLVEDILVGDEFQTRHAEYFSSNWTKFTEDPLESTELEKLSKERFNIFRAHSVEMAAFIESELKRSLGEQFEIQRFLQEVEARVQNVESALAQDRTSGEGEGIPDEPPQMSPVNMDGEIFDMLLTLKDYARFQEFMEDYSKMMQGITPDMDDLVRHRKISDDEAESV